MKQRTKEWKICYEEGVEQGRKEMKAELIDKMIELADKKHRWGKLWNYLKQIKEARQ